LGRARRQLFYPVYFLDQIFRFPSRFPLFPYTVLFLTSLLIHRLFFYLTQRKLKFSSLKFQIFPFPSSRSSMLSMNEQGKDHQTSPRFSDDQSAKVTADGVEFAEPEICWSNMNENAEDLFEFMSTEGINPRLLQLEDSFPGNTPSSNPLSISKPQQEDCKKNESVRPIPRPKPEPIVTTTTNATISPSMSMEDDGNGNNSGQEEKLYCYCRQPDDFKFMIQCDYCEEW
jgi:hypothetical protein